MSEAPERLRTWRTWPWRRIAGLVISPIISGPVLALLTLNGERDEMDPQHPIGEFLSGWWNETIWIVCLGLPAAGVVLLARRWLRLPGMAWDTIFVFSGFFALVIGGYAVALGGSALNGLMGVLMSLPAVVAYCLIAGVPWRTKSAD